MNMKDMAKNDIERVIHLMFSINRLLRKHESGKYSAAAPPFIYLEIMKYLDGGGDITMKALADYLSIRAPSVTVLVDEMTGRGLVKREHDKNDRRVITIHLTKKGEDILAKKYGCRAERFRKVLSDIPETEQKSLAGILGSIQRLLIESEKKI